MKQDKHYSLGLTSIKIMPTNQSMPPIMMDKDGE